MDIVKSKGRLFLLLSAFIIIFIGLLLGPLILENILKPLSIVLWIILRFFILSIDQKVLWGIIIFSVLIFFLIRFNNSTPVEQRTRPETNSSIENLEFWRYYLSTRHHRREELKILKRKLAWMLVSIYASRKRIPANYEVFDAFKLRGIYLPEKVYSFLFAAETKKSWHNPRRWLPIISGPEAVEYYLNLKECLIFLEKFMEIKNE